MMHAFDEAFCRGLYHVVKDSACFWDDSLAGGLIWACLDSIEAFHSHKIKKWSICQFYISPMPTVLCTCCAAAPRKEKQATCYTFSA